MWRFKKEPEICICAAVKDKTGYIWRGHRHCDCLELLEASGNGYAGIHSQGFITSKNRFVTREEGMKLQLAAGIKCPNGSYRGNKKGFTLIEVMIVIAICGIILAMIIPAVHRNKHHKKYNVQQNQQTIVNKESQNLPFGVDILVIDGCQYITYHEKAIIHKANCNNPIHSIGR